MDDVFAIQPPVLRNVYVGNRRTSMRLDDDTWRALELAAEEEGISVSELVTRIDEVRSPSGSLSGAVRSFLIAFLMAKNFGRQRNQA
ncbi:ribbon-helix-helix domain-containing protein [Arenibaculum pallidiluteum]|uniref:ribbon-helix-helix domain-containing protein n=1 Tax=Arenibaculum pallidiluteum TaxID=2812559 RepID=UPI001A95EA26|nr:ribbon-helix-helix domain-containing protein [Arenibaculum pallidiluteum]